MDPAVDLVLRGALALLFGAAAVHKASDAPGFQAVLAEYRLLPGAAVPPVAGLLIAVEAALAAALLLPFGRAVTAGAAAALLAIYTGAIAVNLARGRRDIECGCGGPAGRQPLGPALLLRNAILIGAAIAAAGPAGARPLATIDAVTVAGGLATLALLYAAAGRLIAVRPDRGLRRAS